MTFDADRFFAALAHPLRLRALVLLHLERELCVCELTHALEVSQPMISRHLALLREAGVVQDRRDGLWVHYRLHPQLPDWAAEVVARTATGVAGQTPYSEDREALAAMADRPPIRCCA